jgi:hypothetical protein
MKQFEQFFDALFAAIANVLMSLIRRLAKFAVAVPPAWYWGTIIHESSGSLTVGIAAAIVLEIGGMLSAYYAVAYWGTAKGKLAAVLTGLYLLIGIGVMWLIETASYDEKLIITAVFIIAGMVYVLSAMSELENKELAAIGQDRAWERVELEKDNELRRQLRLQQQADKTAVTLAKIEQKKATVARSDAAQMPLSLPSDFRLLTDQQRHIVSNLSSGELQNIADISASTARRWKQQVSANGSAK